MPLSLPAICHITFSSPGTCGQENVLPAFGYHTTVSAVLDSVIKAFIPDRGQKL